MMTFLNTTMPLRQILCFVCSYNSLAWQVYCVLGISCLQCHSVCLVLYVTLVVVLNIQLKYF